MGWMHDTLEYLKHDPVHRVYHHNEITFSILYAWSENFLLPLSHDEVVHGKGALVNKFPGDRWQKLATLRALYGYMWSHPGKKLLFMGGEFGQNDEWQESKSLDWHLVQYPEHSQIQNLVKDLNHSYREHAPLWERDASPSGFKWLIEDDGSGNIIAFARFNDAGEELISVTNFSPVPQEQFYLPLPSAGNWYEILNTDATKYGGSGVVNEIVHAEANPFRNEPYSANLRVPPLGTLWLTRRNHKESN
jgi:1,4-alpha-glucan branching enzyme